jgi:hypothetical protein
MHEVNLKRLRDWRTRFFCDKTFEDVKTGIGVVATKWVIEQPMIFKGDVVQAQGALEPSSPALE